MRFLKIILAIGGVYECLMGLVIFFFIRQFFGLLGAEDEINYIMYPRSLGVLAFAFGLLMLGSARDPERYILIPLVSIILRLLIQVPIILGAIELPAMALPFIGFGAGDLILAVITVIAIKSSGVDWRNW